ncbi:MAG: DUF4397 domain-containing protein, partial [Chloroflexota bacterium]|nr:DUF4397 domain-containing protein [Chloroflexota bacterium]
GSACVLLVHAAAGAPTVDVAVDGEAAADGLDFGRASSYLALPPGEHQIRLSEAGTDEALLDLSLAFEAGLAYEVVAYIQDDAPTAAILSTNLDPLADDRARVRVFQAIPGAPPAEVALAGGETLIAGVEYGSATDYAEVPTGETPVDLEVRPAGVPIVFPIPRAGLEPGLVYTFYALGDLADLGSLGVLPVVAPTAGSATDGTPVPAAEPIPLSPGNPGTPAATPAA